MKTRPFDLEAAKQGAKLVTRSGKPARIICFDKNSNIFPIVALVKDNYGNEFPCVYTNKGNYYSDDRATPYDLFILECLQCVPYESAEEFLQAQREHGWYLKDKYNGYKFPVEVDDGGVIFEYNNADYVYLFIDKEDADKSLDKNFVWADGTPCGKLKED